MNINRIVAVLALVASAVLADWVHIPTQSITPPSPNVCVDGHYNVTADIGWMEAHDWRVIDFSKIPAPAAGYERLSPPLYTDIDGHSAGYVLRDTLIQARLDAEATAASNAASNAAIAASTPVAFPVGIETPVVVLLSQTNGSPAIGLVADTNGTLVTYVDHASPRTNWWKNMTIALTNREDMVAALKLLKIGQTNAIAEAQAAKAAAQALTLTGFTGAQSNTLKQFRATMIDSAQATIDTAQAANVLRRTLQRFYNTSD